MRRAGAPARTALMDRVEAILRDAAPMPVGTHEVGRALGPWRYRFPPTCDHDDCTRDEHQLAGVTWGYHPADVTRPLLLRLVRRGRAERIKVPRGGGFNPNGQDYWRYLGSTPFEEATHG